MDTLDLDLLQCVIDKADPKTRVRFASTSKRGDEAYRGPCAGGKCYAMRDVRGWTKEWLTDPDSERPDINLWYLLPSPFK